MKSKTRRLPSRVKKNIVNKFWKYKKNAKSEQDIPEAVRIEMAEIRELFAPDNIPVWYSGVVLDHDSETDSNEYEWGPDVLSTTSSKGHNEDQEAITKEDLSIAKQKMELERRQEKLRI